MCWKGKIMKTQLTKEKLTNLLRTREEELNNLNRDYYVESEKKQIELERAYYKGHYDSIKELYDLLKNILGENDESKNIQ